MASPIITDSITTTRAPQEDTLFTISGISIADTDGGSQTVTLTSANGKINLPSTTGIATVSGNNTGSVTLTGSLTAINTAMAAMTFLGAANSTGAATVVVASEGITKTIDLSISPVNDTPTMSGGTPLSINEGGTTSFTAPATSGVGFTQAQLGLADIDNSTTQVILKLTTLPSSGTLKLNGVEIAVGSTFSASQLTTLSYTHNGAEVTAPAGETDTFNITVDDGAGGLLIDRPVSVKIMPVNDAPTVSGTINIIEGETAIRLDNNGALMAPFSSARGAITGADVDDLVLTYKITSLPAVGTLKYNNTNIDLTSGAFTVTDLSKLTYSHDGSESTTSRTFGISVTDAGGGTLAPRTSPGIITLNILPNNDDPLLAHNVEQSPIAADFPLPITTAMLQVTDVDSPNAALTYTVTAVPDTANGYFKLGGCPRIGLLI